MGAISWAALGTILLGVVVASGASALSGILIPLLIAVILSTVLEPLVTALRRFHVPASLAAAIALVIAVVITAGLCAVIVIGFAQQLPQISEQLWESWRRLKESLLASGVDVSWVEPLRSAANDALPQLGFGLLGAVTSAVWGVASFIFSAFLALFFLYFALRDGRLFPVWLARAGSWDESRIMEIDGLARQSLRGYFTGIAVTALITAPIFVVPLLLLRVPLLVPMLILYFTLSFVPYVGAWITGAFAVLIAFGSGGAIPALIVGASLMVSNGTIQSVVSSWALGNSLKLHPVSVLLSTLIGGAIAGILGMVLGPPLVSLARRSLAVLRRSPQL